MHKAKEGSMHLMAMGQSRSPPSVNRARAA